MNEQLKEKGLKAFNGTTNSGFGQVIKLLLLAIVLGILIENLYELPGSGGGFNWIGLTGIIVLLGLFLRFWGIALYRIIHTPYFAVGSLLFIAIGTGLGTFITQNTAPEIFVQRYGINGSRILRSVQLDDVFHSLWYVILFLLLVVSLIKISLIRPFSKVNVGFHLAHLGPVVVLGGFWLDFYAGYGGVVQMFVGQDNDHVWVYHRNTNRVADSLKLDFKLRLEDFQSEKFDPDHRIQIWRLNNQTQSTAPSNPSGAQILTTLPLRENKKFEIYNSDISVELKAFYPNFYFKFSYPEDKDTVAPRDPGILIDITKQGAIEMMQLQDPSSGRHKIYDPILRTSFQFHWVLPNDLSDGISNFDSSSALADTNRIIFSGEDQIIHEVYNGVLTTKDLVKEVQSPIPGSQESFYSVIVLYPDGSYLQSGPASRNDRQEKAVAQVEVNRTAWENKADVFLFPHKGGGVGQFQITGTNYLLALESMKDRETKYWRSDLAILNDQGEVVKRKSVKVNEPLLYRGHRFYQTDYDANNPNYSGIGVSYTPGLYIVYFGFFVLMAGVFVLFYLRR